MASECWVIEARWEQSHETLAAEKFFMVDQIGGTLEDAKRSAQTYFDAHVASSDSTQLNWCAGVLKGRTCYYANTRFISLRVSS